MEPQEASLRPLSTFSCARGRHFDKPGYYKNDLMMNSQREHSYYQRLPLNRPNDLHWWHLLGSEGIAQQLLNNPHSTQPLTELRRLSSSAGTRGVLHRSYCSCISGTDLVGTALVYSTRIHCILSRNSGPCQIPRVFRQFLQAIFR
jgi:hypothetical protein